MEVINEDEKPLKPTCIKNAQILWAEQIKLLGSEWQKKATRDQIENMAKSMMSKLYHFEKPKDPEDPEILFNPTLSNDIRINEKQTISYFIGEDNDKNRGFALTPWKDVQFEKTYKSLVIGNVTLVMGRYLFIDIYGNPTPKIDYTFGYHVENGEYRIFLHHSSLQYMKEMNFCGIWKDEGGELIEVKTNDNQTVTVKYNNGRGTFHGFFLNLGSPIIRVNFSDGNQPDAGVQAGVLNLEGSNISWSNGTKWDKVLKKSDESN